MEQPNLEPIELNDYGVAEDVDVDDYIPALDPGAVKYREIRIAKEAKERAAERQAAAVEARKQQRDTGLAAEMKTQKLGSRPANTMSQRADLPNPEIEIVRMNPLPLSEATYEASYTPKTTETPEVVLTTPFKVTPRAKYLNMDVIQREQIVPDVPFAPQSQPAPVAASAAISKSPMNRNATLVSLITNGAPPRLGDKQTVVANYENLSLCNQVTEDALRRAHAAMQILDKEHASAIQALLDKASNKSGNAKHPGKRPITFKKATSIALKAERWVYQAQAAAAKQMVKKAKKCLHDMAGRRKRTTEEKAATYAKRVANGQSGYSGVRPKGNSAQARRRARIHLAKLEASLPEAADNME